MLGFSTIADAPVTALRQDALIAVTGVSATTAVHSVTISAGVTKAVTGQTVTSAIHGVTASGAATINPTAQTITSGMHSVTVLAGDVSASVTSAGTATTTVHSVALALDAVKAVTGQTITSAINGVTTPILVSGQTLTTLLNSVTARADADIFATTAATLNTAVNDAGVDFSMAVYPTGITVTTRVNSRPMWRPIIVSAGSGWQEIIT